MRPNLTLQNQTLPNTLWPDVLYPDFLRPGHFVALMLSIPNITYRNVLYPDIMFQDVMFLYIMWVYHFGGLQSSIFIAGRSVPKDVRAVHVAGAELSLWMAIGSVISEPGFLVLACVWRKPLV
jgi:hypothetical protein